jgi:16S rRNA (adenine1518-N6/adenine1519-N6)-dimethyltransferase
MTELRRRHRPRKRFGQHFLESSWAARVVAAIAPAPGDVFLEIGPGPGALTFPLARSGAPILAVEIDRDLVADLARRVPPNVTVITGDVLKTDVVPFLTGLGGQASAGQLQSPGPSDPGSPGRRFRVVGNLPYNLSTPILFRLIALQQQHQLFGDATIMLQREVADRLVAAPGRKDYGVLTVLLRLHATVTRLLDLPQGAFRPAPKVRSSVVRLDFGPSGVRVADPLLFETVVKRIFGQRRKTLSNSLKSLVRHPDAALQSAGINGRRRPETLDLAELARLADAVAVARREAVL